MSEIAHNSERPGDPDAAEPVEVPPEEAQGPEQPPFEGTVMAPKPDSEKDEEPGDRRPSEAPPVRGSQHPEG